MGDITRKTNSRGFQKGFLAGPELVEGAGLVGAGERMKMDDLISGTELSGNRPPIGLWVDPFDIDADGAMVRKGD